MRGWFLLRAGDPLRLGSGHFLYPAGSSLTFQARTGSTKKKGRCRRFLRPKEGRPRSTAARWIIIPDIIIHGDL